MEPTQYQNQPNDNPKLIPLAIVAAGALIAGAIYLGAPSPSRNIFQPQTGTVEEIIVDEVSSKDHIRGNTSAKVIVIEYSDLECPFCKVFHTTMKQIMDTYKNGEVAWVYRHYPIAQLHPKAAKEAEASECAAELGGNLAFWQYIDRVFEITNANNSLDLALLPQIAGSIGLDVPSFNDCLNSGKYAETINQAVISAGKAGARGTPYSIVIGKNGQKIVINGAEPFETVKAKIDTLLR